MTAQKHLKQLVRSRMKKTGESYATARRQVIQRVETQRTDPALRWHFPGNVPATTALRVLVAHAGVRAPHSGEPFSECMLFGIAGGIGAGVFSFFYEKEDFASFFIAGRHGWHDDLNYMRQTLAQFEAKPIVRESSGSRAALSQLRDILSELGPCVAWVDAANLPHRAMPALWSGGGYHVITVYRIDDDRGDAVIGDLADDPLPIALADLATARARIKKQKNRLLAFAAPECSINLAELVRDGLSRCHQGLVAGRAKNFQLESFRVWGERLHGSKDRESWERVFTPGRRLWRGLTSIYDFIEHYGTGGGLCRPIFADFLHEAAAALDDSNLHALAKRYAEIGREWVALANAALPDSIPMFRDAKAALARKAELTLSGGSVASIRELWNQLDELAREANERFPLSNSECDGLRKSLQQRVLSLYASEVSAARALAESAASVRA
jgi:hypothetical protein